MNKTLGKYLKKVQFEKLANFAHDSVVKAVLCLSFFVSFAACTRQVESPPVDDSVKVNSTFIAGQDTHESVYNLFAGACHVSWQTRAVKKAEVLQVQVMNRSDCKLSFSEAAPLLEKVITRILKDYPAATLIAYQPVGLKPCNRMEAGI